MSLRLAERISRISNRREGLWVREVRKLTSSGHQTSLISTAYGQLGLENAGRLFSRWSQEACQALYEHKNNLCMAA